jgi:hypothetical protein
MWRRVPVLIVSPLFALLLVLLLFVLNPPPPFFPPLRPCFVSLTCACCRLRAPGPRSLAPRLALRQDRRPRGRLAIRFRPRPRPRRLRLVSPRRSTHRFGRIPCSESDSWVRWEEEAEERDTWGRVAESLIRVRHFGLGTSGVGFGMLRHREDLVVRRSGLQEDGRREAPRRALRRAPRLRVVSRLLRALDNLGRASAGAVEAAAASAA